MIFRRVYLLVSISYIRDHKNREIRSILPDFEEDRTCFEKRGKGDSNSDSEN
jgi:hypothetical protein